MQKTKLYVMNRTATFTYGCWAVNMSIKCV